MKNNNTLIACGIFKDEINSILKKELDTSEIDVIWLDPGLHSQPSVLEQKLSSAINSARDPKNRSINVLVGRGCLAHKNSMLDWKDVSFASTSNCLTALLGEDKVKELEQSNTMLMTPSWVRVWPESMKRCCGWNEVDFRMNLGRYDSILVLDPEIRPLTENEILEFYDLVQVPIDFMTLDLEHFKNVLKNLLD